MKTDAAASAQALIENKKNVPFTFNKIAHRYDFATHLSQGYSKDLKNSVNLLGLNGD
jgi:hypothetical protein